MMSSMEEEADAFPPQPDDEPDGPGDGEESNGEDEPPELFDAGPPPPQGGTCEMQKKLHLFQCNSVRQSLRRLWSNVPKDDDGLFAMEGYVELNLRLQKSLTKDFVLQPALDSAVGDWAEDVRDGQRNMSFDEFAMFVFELCSLWCGPSISLRVYLLFLNALFITVTEARGAHTVGLKQLEGVERLPKAFFDLLTVQGWAKPSEEQQAIGLNEEKEMTAWFTQNLSPDSEQATLLQVQRQVFQVTHDVRSVFLFRGSDGRPCDDADALELVKLASKNLAGVNRVDAHVLATACGSARGAACASASVEASSRPWCPPNFKQAPPLVHHPGRGRAAAAIDEAGARSPGAAARRTPTGGGQIQQYRPPRAPPRDRSAPAPVGRAFETRRARPEASLGLALAGRCAVVSTAGCCTAEELSTMRPSTFSSGGRTGAGELSRQPTANADLAVSQFDAACSPRGRQLMESLGGEGALEAAAAAASGNFLEGAHLSPAYRLPEKPAELYRKQTELQLKVKPGSIVFAANKWQEKTKLLPEPFERILRKLPEHTRPRSEGPAYGPLEHPNEPIWFEMSYRLQNILKKQGRRAERKRKRKLRSKLFRGRSRQPGGVRSEGRELREYLDRHAANHAAGYDAPGEAAGEFLGKVHERYLAGKDRLEARPFRVPGAASAGGFRPPASSSTERHSKVVRPVYVPPPEW